MILETGFSWRGVALYSAVGGVFILLQHVIGGFTEWPLVDFSLILVIHASFFRGAHEAAVIALVLGAFGDSLAGGFFGLLMTLRQLDLIAARILAGRIFSDRPLFQAPIVFGGCFFDAVLSWILLALFTDAAPAFGAYLTAIPGRALLSAIAAVPLAAALTWLYEQRFFNLAKRGLQT